MAFNIRDFDATRILNKSYGEGIVYKAFEYKFYEDIFVHESDDCRRKLRYDDHKSEFILLELIYKDTPHTFYNDHSRTIPDYASPASIAYENRHITGYREPAIPSQKGIEENKQEKGDIRKLLQKETDEWLKSF